MSAGIEIPRDDCEWRVGDLGNMANRCDGDQIAVGACGGGFNSDCPGGAFTMVECCRVPEFYYGLCEVRGGTWGELLECPEIHSESGHLVEGFCESGSSFACNGHASEVECCQGHLQGQLVGSTGQCTWLFSGGFGATLECGRNDEAVMGRCSTGGGHSGNGDCPDDNVHGNLGTLQCVKMSSLIINLDF